MKEPHEKGVAHQLDPESWVTACEGGGQALTGARAGRAAKAEPRKRVQVLGADAVAVGGRRDRLRKQLRYQTHRDARGEGGPSVVSEPEHVRKRLPGTWEISRFATAEGAGVSAGKSKDASPHEWP
jgi:hypothetical protein